jgi:hypothetical protein
MRHCPLGQLATTGQPTTIAESEAVVRALAALPVFVIEIPATIWSKQ